MVHQEGQNIMILLEFARPYNHVKGDDYWLYSLFIYEKRDAVRGYRRCIAYRVIDFVRPKEH